MKKLINLQNLKTLSRNNNSFIKEILEVYLSSTPKDVTSLLEAVNVEEWQQVRYFAHKLKSSSNTMGFDDGYRLFQRIELSIKDNEEMTLVPGLCREAAALCEEVTIQVKIKLAEYV